MSNTNHFWKTPSKVCNVTSGLQGLTKEQQNRYNCVEFYILSHIKNAMHKSIHNRTSQKDLSNQSRLRQEFY